MERTLAIVKPDIVQAHRIGAVLNVIEKAGLYPVAMKMVSLTEPEAKAFYQVHAQRPFYQDLVNFMIEGPVVVVVLEGENAVARYRTLMGATNPAQADPGTIRKEFATSIDRNAVHGSDSLDNAKKEIRFFFPNLD